MKKLLGIVLFLFASQVWATTPTISGVTGWTGSAGVELDITGTTMMDEDLSTLVAPFSTSSQTMYKQNGANPVADGWAGGAGSYSAAQNLMYANKSLLINLSGSSSSGSHVVGETYFQTADASTGSWFWRMYIKSFTNLGIWLDDTLKFLNVYTGGARDACFWNINNNGANGATAPDSLGVECASSFTNGNLPEVWPDDTWNLIEMEQKCSSGSGANGTKLWYKNQLIISITSPGLTCYDGSGFPSPGLFANGWSSPSNYDQDFYIDGFGLATTRLGPASLIEITSGSNYAATSYAAGTRVYLDPTSLGESASSAIAKIPSGGGPYYLWVTNQRGERSSGFLLDGGAPAATKAPFRL